MANPLTYSWIALTASAPVILLLTCWILAVFHCKRRQWSGTDVFLVAILSQSVLQQFLGFIYSTLVLLKLQSPPTGEVVCSGMIWFFISIPIFKGTTITSLAVDRWLFYSRLNYRLSIRKNHIRYHISVLAIFASTIGFTALITFNNPELLMTLTTSSHSQYSFDQCTFLPFKFDLKFVIFYLSVHCIIVIAGIAIISKCMCHKSKGRTTRSSQLLPYTKKLQYKRRGSLMDFTPTTLSNTSTASSTISNGSPPAFFSTPGLTAKAVLSSSSNSPNQSSNNHHMKNCYEMDANARYLKDDRNSSPRLFSAVGLTIMTVLCTHLVYMVATILSRLEILIPISGTSSNATLSLHNWPVTNILLWLQVIEGLCILLILFLVDDVVPLWIFNRKEKDNYDAISHLPHSYIVRPTSNEKAETRFYPVPSRQTNINNENHERQENGHVNNAFTPEINQSRSRPIKLPVNKGFSYFQGQSPSKSQDNQRRYPFLQPQNSRDMKTGAQNQAFPNGRVRRNSGPSFDTITREFQEDESEYEKKSYHNRYSSVASVTTVANDDFEFHQSHPSPSVLTRPLPTNPTETKLYNSSTYTVPKPPTLGPQCVKPRKSDKSAYLSPSVYETSVRQSTILRGHDPPTSLSMNDLDLIDTNEYPPNVSTSTTPGTVYECKQRIYRKRGRLPQNPPLNKTIPNKSIMQPKPITSEDKLSFNRRVLSMECLSSSPKQTEHKNIVDISYLDTGEILFRKADSSKCVFVTDFI